MEQDVETVSDSERIEIADRVETFVRVAGTADPHDLEFGSHPQKANVAIRGPRGESQTLDTTPRRLKVFGVCDDGSKATAKALLDAIAQRRSADGNAYDWTTQLFN